MSDESNKTEEPTAKRLSEAADEGNFARCPDLQLVAGIGAFLWSLSVFGKGICEEIGSIAVGVFAHLSRTELRPEASVPWVYDSFRSLLLIILPFSISWGAASAGMALVQSRFRLTGKVVGLKFDRLDPSAGIQRIFSASGLVRVALDAVRLMVVGWVIYSGIWNILYDPIFNSSVPLIRLGEFLVSSTRGVLWRCMLSLGVIAVLNYAYQVYRVRKSLMMTKQEVKDEARQAEGDPKVKSALRAMARRLLQRQMLKSLEMADVVVTNPSHFAVALRYNRGFDSAPIIVAKGEQAFARRIKALAREFSTPVVENAPVARMLYKFGKVGRAIPVNMYAAVAEILAFVYTAHKDYFKALEGRRSSVIR